jgi:hypothetical protein
MLPAKAVLPARATAEAAKVVFFMNIRRLIVFLLIVYQVFKVKFMLLFRFFKTIHCNFNLYFRISFPGIKYFCKLITALIGDYDAKNLRINIRRQSTKQESGTH